MLGKKRFVGLLICFIFTVSFSSKSFAYVNPRTLNYAEKFSDFSIPCYSNPLSVLRTYSAFLSHNGSFGQKWTFNYDVTLVEKGDTLEILESDGRRVSYAKPGQMADQRKSSAKELVRLQKAANDQKKISLDIKYYQELYKKLQTDDRLFEEKSAALLPKTKKSSAGRYESFDRGFSFVTKLPDGNFVREMADGRKDYFNKSGQLVRITDRNDNSTNLQFVGGKLKFVSDACGRKIQFGYNKRLIKIII